MRSALALVVVGLVGGCGTAQAKEIEGLPLRAGAKWIYKGTVTVPDPKVPTHNVTHVITWTVKVKGVTVHKDRVVARVEGDVTDLDFWNEATAPSEAFIIQRGSRYYRARSADEDGDAFVEVPTEPGARLCPERETDERMCWVVDKVDRTTLGKLPAAGHGERPRYVLVQRDNTGEQVMEVVPGIGITAYRYHHRGSTSDVDVSLVDYWPGR